MGLRCDPPCRRISPFRRSCGDLLEIEVGFALPEEERSEEVSNSSRVSGRGALSPGPVIRMLLTNDSIRNSSPRTPWRLFLCCISAAANRRPFSRPTAFVGRDASAKRSGKRRCLRPRATPSLCRLALLLPALEKSFANSALSVLSSPPKNPGGFSEIFRTKSYLCDDERCSYPLFRIGAAPRRR